MEMCVALVENSALQEVYIMQVAFVKIGLERAAFIQVSEMADRDAVAPST